MALPTRLCLLGIGNGCVWQRLDLNTSWGPAYRSFYSPGTRIVGPVAKLESLTSLISVEPMPPYSDSLTIFGLPAFHRLLSRVMIVSIDEKLRT